uniref:Uncharacterized protein n=1 Tax=uncultured marine virus TaxID=186617 RepID=A0A0F7L929_9VIRU|nr:hypothetical protein [uncultured marine virus]
MRRLKRTIRFNWILVIQAWEMGMLSLIPEQARRSVGQTIIPSQSLQTVGGVTHLHRPVFHQETLG